MQRLNPESLQAGIAQGIVAGKHTPPCIMAPQCRILEAAAAKLAKPEDAKVKDENGAGGGAPTPSPTKRLATEMEKKMKNMAGDTTLVKDMCFPKTCVSHSVFLL